MSNKRSFWKLAGAGVWWPDRDLDREPLIETEFIMSIATQIQIAILEIYVL